MALLDDQEIRARLDDLQGWTREGEVIRKTFTFGSFPEAVQFVNLVAQRAQAADHHPDIDIRYDRVSCALSTHSEGGLTAKDFDLAAEIEEVR